MGSYRDNFALIDFSKEIEARRKPRHEPKRSSLAMPMVISDIMEPVQSQATGKIYDTKSGLRAEYRATGHVEVGNDKRPPFKKPRVTRAEVQKTVQKAAARVERGERNLFPGK